MLGPVSGYYGGTVDSVIMRIADIFFAFPYILFVLLIMSVLGQGFQNVFIAIGVLGWATFARVVRGPDPQRQVDGVRRSGTRAGRG